MDAWPRHKIRTYRNRLRRLVEPNLVEVVEIPTKQLQSFSRWIRNRVRRAGLELQEKTFLAPGTHGLARWGSALVEQYKDTGNRSENRSTVLPFFLFSSFRTITLVVIPITNETIPFFFLRRQYTVLPRGRALHRSRLQSKIGRLPDQRRQSLAVRTRYFRKTRQRRRQFVERNTHRLRWRGRNDPKSVLDEVGDQYAQRNSQDTRTREFLTKFRVSANVNESQDLLKRFHNISGWKIFILRALARWARIFHRLDADDTDENEDMAGSLRRLSTRFKSNQRHWDERIRRGRVGARFTSRLRIPAAPPSTVQASHRRQCDSLKFMDHSSGELAFDFARKISRSF